MVGPAHPAGRRSNRFLPGSPQPAEVTVGRSAIGWLEAHGEASFAAARIEVRRDCSNCERTVSGAGRPLRRALTITTSESACGVRRNASEMTSTRGIKTPERCVIFAPLSSSSETDARGNRATAARTTLGTSGSATSTSVEPLTALVTCPHKHPIPLIDRPPNACCG